MKEGSRKTLLIRKQGQSMVEFAMILPLLVLFILGIFELGRAFFAFIAITNGAREGARIITFWPQKITVADVETAVKKEAGLSPMVNPANIISIQIECGNSYDDVPSEKKLADCPQLEPVRVSVAYQFNLILRIIFPQTLILHRSAEMMFP